jgi:hypothetical protein
MQGGGHAAKSGVQQRLERPQLGREAVAGMDARHAARVRAADGGADRVTGPARPAGGLKLGHELVDLRAVEQRRDLYRGLNAVIPFLRPRRSHLLVQTPGGSRLGGGHS